MSAEQVTFILLGGMGAMATAVITLYRALSKAYTDQVKDVQVERDRWQKMAQDSVDALRVQSSVAIRAVNAAERQQP